MMYALDSNIISYMLRKDKSVCEKYLAESADGHECIIPPVVYYEIKRGLLLTNATSKAKEFDLFCREFGVGVMSVIAWNEAARLYVARREMGKPIEDADLFIAAFCLVNGYALVTNNAKHFEGIDGLQIVNWVE